MKTITLGNFNENLSAYLSEVCDEDTILSVVANNGKTCVVMNEHEYNGLLETMHLLSSVTNQRRLDEAIDEMNRGSIELFSRGIID